ncbi:MAG: hypothetical protein KGL63_13805, partial [Betaproteobacteria bacterium]|nr:hypothetical protein [Betaproteobacteria bacterium]
SPFSADLSSILLRSFESYYRLAVFIELNPVPAREVREVRPHEIPARVPHPRRKIFFASRMRPRGSAGKVREIAVFLEEQINVRKMYSAKKNFFSFQKVVRKAKKTRKTVPKKPRFPAHFRAGPAPAPHARKIHAGAAARPRAGTMRPRGPRVALPQAPTHNHENSSLNFSAPAILAKINLQRVGASNCRACWTKLRSNAANKNFLSKANGERHTKS